MILRSEDLFGDPEVAYGEVLEFLGLPPHSLRDYKPYNAHKAPKGMARRRVSASRRISPSPTGNSPISSANVSPGRSKGKRSPSGREEDHGT
jgi:hypothetical protein